MTPTTAPTSQNTTTAKSDRPPEARAARTSQQTAADRSLAEFAGSGCR
ncbi:hypothetical protein ACFU7Y_40090 [Kitasatospora sp. NPDC057542]